jgi:hypothetical protein
MRLSPDKAIMCLRMLLEGTSVRSVERLSGVNRNTIMSLVVTIGSQDFLWSQIQDVAVADVQADEIWSYVEMKERTRQRLDRPETKGDAWTFVAMERTTKLVLCWHMRKLTKQDTLSFAYKLRDATAGRFQITTDGYLAKMAETMAPTSTQR